MNKIFNLTSTFKSQSVEDGSVMIRGMASTNDFDRAGDTISADAWAKGGLKNFENNPIILFNHDYNKPIGRATGVKVTPDGLELEAKISKSAPESVCELVKDGVLGAFSVGFRVKDADYIQETDGYKIKDAELFEVSVVSVPCNQAATFSLAKSFDSQEEWEDFKKTFTNRVDLAGQSLAKDDISDIASETPDGAQAQKEIKMSEEVKTPEIDLEAFAKKVAEETAAKIAMKQAETKAAEEKAAQEAAEKASAQAEEKAAQEAEVKQAIVTGVESGAEKLMAEVEAKLAEKDSKAEEVILQYKKELEEKNDEITKMRESKRSFSDRSQTRQGVEANAKDLMYAHMLGVYTKKGWDTSYGKSILEKAGIEYPDAQAVASDDSLLNVTVSTAIEKEVMLELRLAQIFREIPMNTHSMVLPLQKDTGLAVFHTGGESELGVGGTANSGAGTGLAEAGGTAGTYQAGQVILQAHRLISTTFMDNHVDEEVLVNLMPMLTEGVARAHARAVDNMVLNGNASGPAITGLEGFATTSSGGKIDIDGNTIAAGNSTTLTASMLLEARKDMGKFGINPADVVYVVAQKFYYDLIADAGFADITDVGSDVATKLTGTIGSVFGTPVIISDQLEPGVGAAANTETVAYAVAFNNYAIPRLRGVQVEQDYEVARQRRLIVATQSLGFAELFADAANARSCVKVVATA